MKNVDRLKELLAEVDNLENVLREELTRMEILTSADSRNAPIFNLVHRAKHAISVHEKLEREYSPKQPRKP